MSARTSLLRRVRFAVARRRLASAFGIACAAILAGALPAAAPQAQQARDAQAAPEPGAAQETREAPRDTTLAVEREPGLVLARYALPTETPGDLAWDGEALWLADWKAGELIRIDPASGRTLGRMPAPCYRPRGLAWGAGRLFVADDYEGRIYVFDPATELTNTVYPSPTGTGFGLAHDGESLWLAEPGEDTLQRLIDRDGTVLTYFDAPQRNPSGAAFDGRYLWIAQRLHDRIYMVDPGTGKALTSFASPGPYPCGLAADGDGRLWIADFETGFLYLTAPREAPVYQTDDWRETTLEMTYRIENHGPGTLRDVSVRFAVPRDSLENQRLASPLEYSPRDPLLYQDDWGQGIAEFTTERLDEGERFEVGYTAHGWLGSLNYIIIPEKTGLITDIPDEIRDAYTVDGERYQRDLHLVQETSARIVGAEENPYWIARKIYDWVIDALEYERVGGWDVPETLIKRGTGSCSEYTFLYIGLCRAAGLPARYEAGTAVRGDDASVDDVYHRWAEVYLPGYGWVPVDPSGGDQPTPGGRADYFGRLSNRLFVTTHNGGGGAALGWTYNVQASYMLQGRCQVTEDEWIMRRRAEDEDAALVPSGAETKP